MRPRARRGKTTIAVDRSAPAPVSATMSESYVRPPGCATDSSAGAKLPVGTSATDDRGPSGSDRRGLPISDGSARATTKARVSQNARATRGLARPRGAGWGRRPPPGIAGVDTKEQAELPTPPTAAYARAMANTGDWATEDELMSEPMTASTRVPPPPPRPPAPPTTGGAGSENEDYAVGDAVRVLEGPFADFPGTITEIDSDSRWLRVVIRIFERETPVRLETSQISRRQDRPRPEL
jgi:hypothetical protein